MIELEKVVDILEKETNLTKSDAEWIVDWYPEAFEGYETEDDIRYAVSPSYGYGLRVLEPEEFHESYDEELAENNGEIHGGIYFEDAGLSGILVWTR